MISNQCDSTQTSVIDNKSFVNKMNNEENGTRTLKSKEDSKPRKLLKDMDDKWFFEKYELRYRNIIIQFSFLFIGIHGILTFPYIQHYKTAIYTYLMVLYTMFGITGGVHRLWSHKCFKAKTPLKIILAGGYFLATQVPFKQWVRIHRVHHKYTDTDADPHNSKRGFFYCHFGWCMIQRPMEVKEKIRQIEMSDIHADPVINFCDRHFILYCFLINLFVIAIPVYLWNETWSISIWAQMIRFAYTLHITFSVNSFAHMFGSKPYDKSIDAAENRLVSWTTGGEGWHNYHHVFPYDYRTSEIGGWRYDLTAELLTLFEKIGWAYDLKKPKAKVVEMTIKNRGDGTLLNALMS